MPRRTHAWKVLLQKTWGRFPDKFLVQVLKFLKKKITEGIPGRTTKKLEKKENPTKALQEFQKTSRLEKSHHEFLQEHLEKS